MEKPNPENDTFIICPKCQKSNTLSYIKQNNHASHTGGLYCPNCFCELDINNPTGQKKKEIKKIKSPQKKVPSHCPHCGRYITRRSIANVLNPICQSCGNYVLKKSNMESENLQVLICPYCSINLTIPNDLINDENLMCINCHNDFRNPHYKGNFRNTSQKNSLPISNESEISWYNGLSQKQKKGFKRLIFIIAASLIIVLVNVIPNNSNNNSGNSYITNSGYLAAYNKTSFDAVMECISNKDDECVNQLINSGQVIRLPEGMEVYLVDQTIATVKIRPKGSTNTLWTVIEAIY